MTSREVVLSGQDSRYSRVRRAKFGIGISGTDGEVGYDIKSWGKIKDALIEWAKRNNESLE